MLDNYRTWRYFAKILCNLPTEKITNEIIDLIPVWLDSKFDNMLPATEILEKLLPKFLAGDRREDLQKAEKIVDIVTQIKWVPDYSEQQKKEIREKYKHIFDKPQDQWTEEEKIQIVILELDKEEPKTIIDPYWLIESFIKKSIASKVGEKCSENVILNLANKLKEIFERKYKEKGEGEKRDLSYIWIYSFFEDSEPFSGSVEKILTLILRDIFLAKAQKDIDTTQKIIEKLLSGDYKYPLFRRLILFVIGIEWQTYKEIFWNIINEDKDGTLLNDPHYEAEVYTILQKHISKFSTEEKEKIKNIIEEKVPAKPHPEEKYREYYSAYQKQEWYSAVKDDEYFKPFYEKYKNITGEEGGISFKGVETRFGPGPSPLSKEEILTMTNKELAEYLRAFKTVDFWKGPTIDGLAEALGDAVQEMPEKFVDDLSPFLKTGYFYVYKIFWGIRDALEKKKPINWEKLFVFIKQYITPKDFWDDKYKIEDDKWNADHLWVVGSIGELIRQGTVNDASAFPEKYFQIAQEILFLIIEEVLNRKENEQTTIEDFFTFTLNSPLGKITEALFLLALRIKRVEDKIKVEKLVNWKVSIKDKYETLLKNKVVESYVWLGRYLPNFYYLDKEWTSNKITTITPEKGQLWEAFMGGYLSGGKVYDELYKLMRAHYEKAIDYQFGKKYFLEQVIRHICIGYLRGIEEINENTSLFRKLLDKWDTFQIKEMIRFFWMQRRDYEVNENKQEKEQLIEDEKIKKLENKIIDFWRWVYENKYKGKEVSSFSKEYKEILSELCLITVFLPEINLENFEWLKISAPFVDLGYHSSFFIEYLNNLKGKGQSINFLGKVYLKMLKNATPDFRQEHILSIVEFLYMNGKKDDADKICDIYARLGFNFLRYLYDRYNK